MRFEPLNLNMPGFSDIEIPAFYRVRQTFKRERIDDVDAQMRFKLTEQKELGGLRELRGKRIAITAGSRGIPQYRELLRALCSQLKDFGAEPFVFPAMGSHGGGTAQGQRELLEQAGVTEEYIGAPIVSSMEVVPVGSLEDGTVIYCDESAATADGVIIFHKIKPHPNFKGKHESGLLKMICIGAGKHQGATAFHEKGFENFDERMKIVSEVFLEKVNVVCGVAVMENPYDEIVRIEVIPTEQIIEKDAELLEWSRSQMARLYPENIDVLIIDRSGKEISGTSFDGNIVGRNCESEFTAPLFKANAPDIKRIVLLDLTDETHGCAACMGVADVVSRRFAEKIDFESTYINMFTSKICAGAAMPPYASNDEEAIRIAIFTGVGADKRNPRIVRIKDTLSLETIEVSQAYLDEVRAHEHMELLSEPYKWEFDAEHNLF